jgi:hypothetical protein
VDAEPEQTPMARPTQITTAIWLAAISYVMGLVVVLFSWDYYSRLQTMGAFLGSQLFSLFILIWIYYKIYVGRNWARIVLLVFSVIGVLMTVNGAVMDLLAAAPTIAKVQMFVGLGLSGVILWLLFFSPGRHWFRRSKAGLLPNTSLERTRGE